MSSNICPSCFSRQYEAGRCGKCGFTGAEYKPERTALRMGSIAGTYCIGLMKFNSRQSQVYTAVHTETSIPVIIEEFFPAKVAGRASNTDEVALASGDAESMKRFQQACLLIELSTQKRPLKRIESFRANNTVYSVFEPIGTVSVAAQCEMMADNPYYFRDQNGKPMMTINALPIPDMPLERSYDAHRYANNGPETVVSEKEDTPPVRTEKPTGRKRIFITIGSIAAALALISIVLVFVFNKPDWKGETDKQQETAQTVEVDRTAADNQDPGNQQQDENNSESAESKEDTAVTPADAEAGKNDAEPTENGSKTYVPSQENEEATVDHEPAQESVPVNSDTDNAGEKEPVDSDGDNAGEEETENSDSDNVEEEETDNSDSDNVGKEEPETEVEKGLSSEEFIEMLQIVVAEQFDEYNASKMQRTPKTVDSLMDSKAKIETFTENTPVRLLNHKLIHTSTKNKNKLYVIIEHEDRLYRVPIFEKISEDYIVQEGAALSFESWTTLEGKLPNGTRLYFPCESAEFIKNKLNDILNRQDVRIDLVLENGELNLQFTYEEYDFLNRAYCQVAMFKEKEEEPTGGSDPDENTDQADETWKRLEQFIGRTKEIISYDGDAITSIEFTTTTIVKEISLTNIETGKNYQLEKKKGVNNDYKWCSQKDDSLPKGKYKIKYLLNNERSTQEDVEWTGQ